MAIFDHDPDANLDYGLDWAGTPAEGVPWLSEGETITASTWSVTSGPVDELTLTNSTNDTTTTTIWVSGGVAGRVYQITNHVTSSAGREDDRSHTLVCKDR